MKVLFLLACSISGSLWGQQSEVRSVGTFKGVKSAEAIDVYLNKGTKESVKVEVTGTDLKEVVTEISGSYLKIHMRDNHGYNRRGGKDVKVYVTYISLDKISASSASNIFSTEEIKAESMELHASSAASIEIKLDATDVQVSVSSAAKIMLEGKTKSITAEASSAGEINAYNLASDSAIANVSSAGDIKLNVANALVSDASSGGSIHYRGNPSKTMTNSSSGGSVKRSN